MVHPVKTNLAAFLFFILCSLIGRAGINLTPSEVVVDFDGAKCKRVCFRNDSGYIVYAPPDGWSYNGSSGNFIAQSADANPATLTIEPLSVLEPFVLNEEQKKRSAGQIIAALPKGCEKVTLVSQSANQIRVSGNETMETIVSYVVYGRTMEMSVLDVNFRSEILRFKLVSDKPVFGRAHDLFCVSLTSWAQSQKPPQPAS